MTPEVKLSNRVNFGWITESYDLYKQDFTTWIGVTILFFVVFVFVDWAVSLLLNVPSMVTVFEIAFNHFHTVSAVPSLGGVLCRTIASCALNGFFSVGLFAMANKAVRGQPVGFVDLVSHLNVLPQFLIYAVVIAIPNFIFDIVYYSVVVPSGNVPASIVSSFVLLFLQMLLAPLFCVVAPLIADHHSFGDAFKLAIAAVTKDWFRAVGLVFIFSIVFIVSCCPCGLGMLITVPMTCIIPSLAYRDMIGMPKAVNNAPPEGPGDSWPPKPQSGG